MGLRLVELKFSDFSLMSSNKLNLLAFEIFRLKNKPNGLKVAKEDQRSVGLMVNRLDGQ